MMNFTIWLLLVSFHAAPPPFGTVFPHLYALLIVSLVLGLSSRLMCSLSSVHSSDILIMSFMLYKFVTYWIIISTMLDHCGMC